MGVVEQKQTLPILSNVMLSMSGQSLTVTGTDLEVELIGRANTEFDYPEHQITIAGRKLFDICKALPDNATIELHQERDQVMLKSGRSRFTLSTLPAAEFPNMETSKSVCEFSIPQNELKNILQRTSFAMAQNDVRYYLNGILLEITPNQLRTVATDGHRLASATASSTIETSTRVQIIIPRKGVLELIKLLDDTHDIAKVIIGTHFISVESDQYHFTSKLIEGRFPEYERVIPKNNDKIAEIEKNDIKLALQRSAILCNEKFRGIRLVLEKNKLKIFANNPEHEAAEEELPIIYHDEKIDIAFNVSYLIENLNIIRSDTVKLKLSSNDASMLLEEVDPTDDCTFVIMPMRL